MTIVTKHEGGVASHGAAPGKLSRAEVEALRHGGVDLDLGLDLDLDLGNGDGERDAGAASAGLRDWLQLVRESFSTAQAARALRVEESLVRQRLGGERPSLYGFQHERAWHIPRFQIDGDELLPGLDVVVARLDRGLHPVTVARWFQLPNGELVDPRDPDRLLSPIAWLRSGGSPETAAELAAAL